jgi:hypothetical protein
VEDGVPDAKWPLRVLGYVGRSNKRPRYILKVGQQRALTIPRQDLCCIPRRCPSILKRYKATRLGR